MESCWLYNSCNHIDCDKFCIRRYKLDYLYNQAYVSLDQRKHIDLKLDANLIDKNNFIILSNIEKDIVSFIDKGNNLYIHSQMTGNGKTSWVLRLLQAYFNKIWANSNLECKALFIHVPTFLLALKDNISEKSEYIRHIKNNILSADLIIWDDIATKSITSFESEHLLSMLHSRINSNKSNFFTSNLTDEELHQALGDRLSSRILGTSYNFEFKGYDKRGISS